MYIYKVEKKEKDSKDFQYLYRQLLNNGLNWNTQHVRYEIKLANNEKFLQNTLTWPKAYRGSKALHRDFNVICVVAYGEIYKSVDRTDMFKYNLLVKKEKIQIKFRLCIEKLSD